MFMLETVFRISFSFLKSFLLLFSKPLIIILHVSISNGIIIPQLFSVGNSFHFSPFIHISVLQVFWESKKLVYSIVCLKTDFFVRFSEVKYVTLGLLYNRFRILFLFVLSSATLNREVWQAGYKWFRMNEWFTTNENKHWKVKQNKNIPPKYIRQLF